MAPEALKMAVTIGRSLPKWKLYMKIEDKATDEDFADFLMSIYEHIIRCATKMKTMMIAIENPLCKGNTRFRLPIVKPNEGNNHQSTENNNPTPTQEDPSDHQFDWSSFLTGEDSVDNEDDHCYSRPETTSHKRAPPVMKDVRSNSDATVSENCARTRTTIPCIQRTGIDGGTADNTATAFSANVELLDRQDVDTKSETISECIAPSKTLLGNTLPKGDAFTSGETIGGKPTGEVDVKTKHASVVLILPSKHAIVSPVHMIQNRAYQVNDEEDNVDVKDEPEEWTVENVENSSSVECPQSGTVCTVDAAMEQMKTKDGGKQRGSSRKITVPLKFREETPPSSKPRTDKDKKRGKSSKPGKRPIGRPRKDKCHKLETEEHESKPSIIADSGAPDNLFPMGLTDWIRENVETSSSVECPQIQKAVEEESETDDDDQTENYIDRESDEDYKIENDVDSESDDEYQMEKYIDSGTDEEYQIETSSTIKRGLKRKRCTYLKYEAGFMLKVVQFAKEHNNNSKTAREFGISERQVHDWIKAEVELAALPKNKKAKRGMKKEHLKGKKGLNDWVLNPIQAGITDTKTDRAKKMSVEIGETETVETIDSQRDDEIQTEKHVDPESDEEYLMATNFVERLGRKKPRCSYDAGYKLKVIQFAKEHNNNCKTARHFGICERQVRDWVKAEVELTAMPKNKKAKRGIKKAHLKDKKALNDWVLNPIQTGIADTKKDHVENMSVESQQIGGTEIVENIDSQRDDVIQTEKHVDPESDVCDQTEKHVDPESNDCDQTEKHVDPESNDCDQTEKHVDPESDDCDQTEKHVDPESNDCDQTEKHVDPESDNCDQTEKHVDPDSNDCDQTEKHVDPESDDGDQTEKDVDPGSDEEYIMATNFVERLGRKKNRCSYDAGYKLKVIEFAKKHNNNCKTARYFGISERQVRDWLKAEGELTALPKTKKAKRGYPTPHLKDEEELKDWVHSLRQEGITVTRREICEQAKKTFTIDSFKASRGWCTNFINRNDISVRKRIFHYKTK